MRRITVLVSLAFLGIVALTAIGVYLILEDKDQAINNLTGTAIESDKRLEQAGNTVRQEQDRQGTSEAKPTKTFVVIHDPAPTRRVTATTSSYTSTVNYTSSPSIYRIRVTVIPPPGTSPEGLVIYQEGGEKYDVTGTVTQWEITLNEGEVKYLTLYLDYQGKHLGSIGQITLSSVWVGNVPPGQTANVVFTFIPPE